MSLCRIDVQQLAPDRWVVELEAGSYARRKRVLLRGLRSFGETVAAIDKAYGELTAPLPVKKAEELAAEYPAQTVSLDDAPTEGSRLNGDKQSVTAGKDRHTDDPVPRETFVADDRAEEVAAMESARRVRPDDEETASIRIQPPRHPVFDRATPEQIAEGRALNVPVDGRWSRDRATKLLGAARSRQQTAAE